jgi:hypothetical protein
MVLGQILRGPLLAEENHLTFFASCLTLNLDVLCQPVQVVDGEGLVHLHHYTSVLDEESQPQQIVDRFGNLLILHCASDIGSDLRRQPLVGVPCIDGSHLISTFFGLLDQVVSTEVLEHLLVLKLVLSIQPKYCW